MSRTLDKSVRPDTVSLAALALRGTADWLAQEAAKLPVTSAFTETTGPLKVATADG